MSVKGQHATGPFDCPHTTPPVSNVARDAVGRLGSGSGQFIPNKNWLIFE